MSEDFERPPGCILYVLEACFEESTTPTGQMSCCTSNGVPPGPKFTRHDSKSGSARSRTLVASQSDGRQVEVRFICLVGSDGQL